MDPVSRALLVALLPTCLLVLILGCLSLYLYLRCRRYNSTRTQSIDLPVQPPPVEELEKVPSSTIPTKPEVRRIRPMFLGHKLLSRLDMTDLDIQKHTEVLFENIQVWMSIFIDRGRDPWTGEAYVKAHVEEILGLLEYQSMPSAAFFKLLHRPETRWEAAVHLLSSIAFDRTSFHGDTQCSLLPFQPDTHKEISTAIKAIHGIQYAVSPDVATELLKIPATIAAKQDWQRANYEKFTKLYFRLLEPYGNTSSMVYNTGGPLHIEPEALRDELNTLVYIRFFMLESLQRFEVRWPETSETSFATEPDIYTHAGEDGIPFDEPKLWRKGNVVTILDDGSVLGRLDRRKFLLGCNSE